MLMSLKKADILNGGYLKAGSANWQSGFGLLNVVGKTTLPTLIPIVNNTFIVEGKVYS